MSDDPNAPVIVGAAAVQQRIDDPTTALDALSLIRTALESAADDAGSRRLLDQATAIFLPQGMWTSANPAQVALPHNPSVRSVVANIGVLQQTLLNRACAHVAAGAHDIVLVAGGEAKYRSLRAQIMGVELVDTPTSGEPTERLVPADDILTREEVQRGLPVPARQYALIDTALRRQHHLTRAEHQRLLADLQSRFSAVAATNPQAWTREPVPASTLIDAGPRNPMLAWPYTKLHCSQWNVDQAAALVVCSRATAERYGIPRDRWVFAHLGIESNLMIPLTLRAEMHRAPAMAVAADELVARCGVSPADVERLELYSCFPAAVRVQAAEMGIDIARDLTVTGGMTFAGGPLNNFTLQSLVTMVNVLRGEPSARGLVTNISGMLTKFGASLWSATPPTQQFAAVDITAQAADRTATTHLVPDSVGDARVLTYTVACDRGVPVQGIVVGETKFGDRVLASTDDVDTMSDMMTTEWCDRQVRVDGALLLT